MKEYIAKKLLLLIPTVLAITFLVFAMMRCIPGDPIHLLLGDMVRCAAGRRAPARLWL